MKAIWMVITTLALANLLAMGGFVGWLGMSGRLNKERVQAVRAIFVPTITQETATRAETEHKAAEDRTAAAAAAKLATPPVGAGERIQQQQSDAEVKLQTKQRLEGDLKSLQTFLVRENDRLQQWEKDLQKRQTAFEAEQKKVLQTQGSDQFKKALATLGGVKPKEAQSILAELLAQNKQDEVISYLNAMDERARSKVLAEFNKADPRVAADLLERLRTRG